MNANGFPRIFETFKYNHIFQALKIIPTQYRSMKFEGFLDQPTSNYRSLKASSLRVLFMVT